jgi:hypothetical protein
MRAVTVATFRDDPLFPKISRVVAIILEKDKVVRPIDVLIGMQLLSRNDLEDAVDLHAEVSNLVQVKEIEVLVG